MRIKKNLLKLFMGVSGIYICFISKVETVSLDGTTGTSIYEAANYVFANGDFATGFVQLKGGFTVPAGGTVSIGVNEPVGGTINLNGGTLLMTDDMELASGTTIIGSGSIVGNNFTMYLGSDLTISSLITFRSDTQNTAFNLDGRGNRLMFSQINNPAIGFNMGNVGDTFTTTMGFNNLVMVNVIGTSGGTNAFPFKNNFTTGFTFKNVEISTPESSQNFGIALLGSLLFQGTVRFVGKNSLVFFFTDSTTIDDASTLYIGPSLNFICDTNTTFVTNNSTLYLDNCLFLRSFFSAGNPFIFLKGRMVINGVVKCEIDLASGALPLTFGDGISADNDFNVEILPGSTFALGRPGIFSGTGEIIYKNLF